jgi:uncharacterized protein (DUF697 family)
VNKPAPLTREALRRIHAQDLVLSHTALAASSMAIPIPLLDAVAELAIQLRMTKKLCALYSADFTKERARAVITGIVGGLSVGAVSAGVLRYLSFASSFMSFMPSASLAGAYTYVIGNMLLERLEEHGKLEVCSLNIQKA